MPNAACSSDEVKENALARARGPTRSLGQRNIDDTLGVSTFRLHIHPDHLYRSTPKIGDARKTETTQSSYYA